MRITFNIDEQSLLLVKKYMKDRHLRFDKAISELVRRGANTPPPVRLVNGLLVFDLERGSQRVTTKQVRNLLSME
jgi:hypothetical protein